MSDSTYQAAAIAAMSSAPGSAPAKVEATPAPALDESKLVVGPDTKGAPEAPEVDETAQLQKEVKSDSIRKSLEHVAREKAAIRQREEAMRPLQALQQRLGPQGIHELSRASEAGDVAAILKALGVKANQIEYEKADETLSAAKQTPPSPEVLELKQKLEALENERRQEKYATGRAHVLGITAELAKDPEFELISDDTDAHAEALSMVEEYIRKFGEQPGKDREDSLRLALRDVNEKYQKEAKRWEERLTKRKQPAKTVPTESPEQSTRAASDVGSRIKPLTNSTSSAPAPSRPPQPRSDEDYIANAVAAMKQIPGN